MMKRMQGRSAPVAVAAVLAATATATMLLVAGCGDNAGNPTGYSPEGQASPAILLLDVQPFSPDTAQVFVQAFIVSPPPADGFRFYVNPDEAGYRPANETPLPATTTFDSGWSLFQTSIDGYDPTTTNLAFIARGARGGIESSAAALSSPGYIPASTALALTRRQPIALLSPPDSAQISAPEFNWTEIPGASAYLLQAFNASTGELGLLVYVPASEAEATELEVSVLNLVPYRWFVTAYDAGGRAFALSPPRQFSYFPPSDAASFGTSRVRVTVASATR